jgi:hypothetical protein
MKALIIGLPFAALSFAAGFWATSSYFPSQGAQAETPQPARKAEWPVIDRTLKGDRTDKIEMSNMMRSIEQRKVREDSKLCNRENVRYPWFQSQPLGRCTT